MYIPDRVFYRIFYGMIGLCSLGENPRISSFNLYLHGTASIYLRYPICSPLSELLFSFFLFFSLFLAPRLTRTFYISRTLILLHTDFYVLVLILFSFSPEILH